MVDMADTLTSAHPDLGLALSATIAAPLPEVTLDGEPDLPAATSGLRTSGNASVLPKVESVGEAVRLAPTSGPRYASLRELGRGGMGEVALVEDRDIGRTVAMKKLLPDAGGPAAVARFVDEIRTIGRLEHPNIVPIHDVGVDEEGRFFFVMKYVDGETLESILDRLRRGDPDAIRKYDVARRVEIFMGVLRALQFAHGRGILHRDLKPANVMVGRFGEVVLMDWGVARRIDKREARSDLSALRATATDLQRASTTRAGALIGTPLYMSPEQARGANDELDERSDLYSAGVMLHEMLSLRHRLEKKTTLTAVLHAITSDDPPNPHRFFDLHPAQREAVGPEFGHFLFKGLQRDPAHRWQSAQEMLDELHAIQSGQCRVQCAATFMKRSSHEATRWIDRSPGAAIAAGVVFSLTFLGLVVHAATTIF